MILFALNLLDMGFTLWALHHGAYELNPAMRWVMGLHPLAFPTVKVVVGGIACWWLEWSAERYPLARLGRRICIAAYGLLCLWHIVNLAAVI